MQILNNFADYSSGSDTLVLALGNFDGLHLGHQELLRHVVESAQNRKARSAVLTFREHPQHILHPSAKPPLLTSLEHKMFLLEKSGVDLCFLIPFTPEFSRMDAEVFVREVLIGKLKVSEVYLGHNARFGKNREGNAELMKELSRKLSFSFHQLGPVQAAGETVSSSRIRTLVREGKLEEAEACLGRKFSVFGRVVHGAGRGAEIGFPTVNMEVESEILPPLGVYPVQVREMEGAGEGDGQNAFFRVQRTGAWLPGVLNYGYRPTFEETVKKAVSEAYLIDYKGDMYGKMLEIKFYPRIRPELTFSGVEALKTQIRADIEETRRILAEEAAPKSLR